jgi:hypothetical protein
MTCFKLPGRVFVFSHSRELQPPVPCVSRNNTVSKNFFRKIQNNLLSLHQGDQRGQKEVFANMPGSPDNIKPSEDGNYIVGIPVISVAGQKSFFEGLLTDPIMAKLMVRLCCLIQSMLESFNTHVTYLETFGIMIHRLGNTEHSGANMVPGYGLLIELDPKGQVVQSWHSEDPVVSKFSEGFLHNGQMYLGSPYNTFVSRVPYH